MAKLVYVSKNPLFAVLCDDLQWILALKYRGRARQGLEDGVWDDRTYHPTIALLLECLAETLLRQNVTKVAELGELQTSIEEVYRIIDRLTINPKHIHP